MAAFKVDNGVIHCIAVPTPTDLTTFLDITALQAETMCNLMSLIAHMWTSEEWATTYKLWEEIAKGVLVEKLPASDVTLAILVRKLPAIIGKTHKLLHI